MQARGFALGGSGGSADFSRKARHFQYTEAVTGISAKIRSLVSEIEEAANACGRDPKTVRLLAVSKTFPLEAVLEAHAAGQMLFGENRVQEGRDKIPGLREPGVEWHLIGHLQTNKAKLAAELFDVIESLDSPKLAERLNICCEQIGKVMPVLIQVNVGGETQKYGVTPVELSSVVELVDSLPNLRLDGLMAIPPWDADPERIRPFFREMRQLLERVNSDRPEALPELSMGMSGDFRVAIQEGATLVRIGTAIFGAR